MHTHIQSQTSTDSPEIALQNSFLSNDPLFRNLLSSQFDFPAYFLKHTTASVRTVTTQMRTHVWVLLQEMITPTHICTAASAVKVMSMTCFLPPGVLLLECRSFVSKDGLQTILLQDFLVTVFPDCHFSSIKSIRCVEVVPLNLTLSADTQTSRRSGTDRHASNCTVTVLSSGYDQRLSLWEINTHTHPCKLRLQSRTTMELPDISALAYRSNQYMHPLTHALGPQPGGLWSSAHIVILKLSMTY